MADFLSAARFTERDVRLPHQDAAWHWAWSCLTDEEQRQFLEMFRAAPARAVPNTWDGITEAARRHGARYPELAAAQWALESRFGQQLSGRHNPLGLKGSGTTKATTEVVDGQEVRIEAEFKDFPSLDAAVEHLISRWYRDWTSPAGRVYQGVNRGTTRNAAAQLLQREGYATDPAYASKLISLMEQHAPLATPSPTQPAPEAPSKPAAKPKPKPEQQQGAPFSIASPFSTQITSHFTYGEFCLYQASRRFTAQHQCDTALELAQFLEKLRSAFGGKSVIITSGHRPPTVNKTVGGASDSEHLFSSPGVGAVDISVEGASIWDVQKWVNQHWPYSVGYGAPRGFVHIGKRRGGPRVRWDY